MSIDHPSHNHAHCKADLLDRAERSCAEKRCRLTGQRRDILSLVAESHQAVGAYDIIERMGQRGARPAPMTVYRALDFLLAQGLVHKIESRNAYVACLKAHEGQQAALLICESCGQVDEIESAQLFAQAASRAAQSGFQPRHTVIEMTGQCATCSSEAK